MRRTETQFNANEFLESNRKIPLHTLIWSLASNHDLRATEVQQVINQLVTSPNFNAENKDREGNTLLHTAALAYKLQQPHAALIFQKILTHPTCKVMDPNQLNKKGFAVLHILAETNRREEDDHLISFFLKVPKLDINQLSTEGKCALFYAIEVINRHSISALLRAKADLCAGSNSSPSIRSCLEKQINLCFSSIEAHYAYYEERYRNFNPNKSKKFQQKLRPLQDTVIFLKTIRENIIKKRHLFFIKRAAARLISQSYRQRGIFSHLPQELHEHILSYIDGKPYSIPPLQNSVTQSLANNEGNAIPTPPTPESSMQPTTPIKPLQAAVGNAPPAPQYKKPNPWEHFMAKNKGADENHHKTPEIFPRLPGQNQSMDIKPQNPLSKSWSEMAKQHCPGSAARNPIKQNTVEVRTAAPSTPTPLSSSDGNFTPIVKSKPKLHLKEGKCPAVKKPDSKIPKKKMPPVAFSESDKNESDADTNVATSNISTTLKPHAHPKKRPQYKVHIDAENEIERILSSSPNALTSPNRHAEWGTLFWQRAKQITCHQVGIAIAVGAIVAGIAGLSASL